MSIFSNIDSFGEKVAIISEEHQSVTYFELDRITRELAQPLLEGSGIVFNLCSNNLESIVGYVGLMNAKKVQVLVNSNLEDKLLASLAEAYKPEYVWLAKERLADISEFADIDLPIFTYGSFVLVKTKFTIDYIIPNELALLLTTSGSTGSPKLVRLSWKNISSNTECIVKFLNISSDDRPITTLPMNYTYGLSILNTHLYKGCTIVLTDRKIMDRGFWKLFEETAPTTFGGVPLTYEMLELMDFENMDLPSLRYLTESGGKLDPETSRRIATVCENKGIKFVLMYGQTEATARVAYLPSELATVKSGSIGIAVPGGKLWLEKDGKIIEEPMTEGEMMFAGEGVSLGYAENCYDLSKPDENRGVLRTGDIAKRDEDGCYYITGRIKRFLKMTGSRVNLDEVQTILTKMGYESVASGKDDMMLIFTTAKENIAPIKSYVKEKLKISPTAFSVRYIQEIPRNESGKIVYAKLPCDID